MAALFAMLLISVIGAALVLATSVESAVAAHFRDSHQALYAADAAAQRALGDLLGAADSGDVLNGVVRATFADGPSAGTGFSAELPTVDLSRTVNLANCGKPTPCSDAELEAVTPERPWGRNNPRWRLFAYGSLRTLLPDVLVDCPYYAVVMVSDVRDVGSDDGPTGGGKGLGRLTLRAEVFGPRGAHRVLEVTVVFATDEGPHVTAWRDLG